MPVEFVSAGLDDASELGCVSVGAFTLDGVSVELVSTLGAVSAGLGTSVESAGMI